MSLSVSSFPEAPPKLASHPKWRKPNTPKCKPGFFGALLSKGCLPFLKHVRHVGKAEVKESIIHRPVSVPVPPARTRHSFSVPPSSKASGIVIDLRSVPHNGECFPPSKIVDLDASSVLEISHSPYTTPVALPFPSTTERVSMTKERNEITLAAEDFEPHNSRPNTASTKPLAEPYRRFRAITSPTSTAPPGFGTTIPPASPLPATPTTPAASTEGRNRPRSTLTGVKQRGTETEPPHRPRYRSETSISVRGATTPPSLADAPRDGKCTNRGKSSPPPLPSGVSSWHTLSNASSKGVGGIKASELPVPTQPARLTAHMLCMRSGSRPLPTHALSSGRLPVAVRTSTGSQSLSPNNPRPTTITTTTTTNTSMTQIPRAPVTRPRSKTSDSASVPSHRRRTTSATSFGVRSSDNDHTQLSSLPPPPPPPPRMSTPGPLDGGPRSRLPVASATQTSSRLGATAATSS